MNTTSHRVYQTGEAKRGSEDAANDLGRLRIRLGLTLTQSTTPPSARLKLKYCDQIKFNEPVLKPGTPDEQHIANR